MSSALLYKTTLELCSGGEPAIVRAIYVENYDTLLTTFRDSCQRTPFDSCLLSSATGFGASAAFAASILSLSPGDFLMGLKLKLGLPIFKDLPDHCTCGYLLQGTHPIIVNAHLLSCPHNSEANMTTRHNGMTKSIQQVLQENHISATLEPRELAAGLRPDILISCAHPVIVDLTVHDPILSIHPADPMHQVLHKPLEAIAEEKARKYNKVASDNNMVFFPLAFETYGYTHRDFDNFIHKVSRDIPYSSRHNFRSMMFIRVQQALMTGNARILRKVHSRILRNDFGYWHLRPSG